MRVTRWLTAAIALGGLVAAAPAGATTSVTRTSSFAYDAATGLLTQEVVEPNTTALRLETDYVYDAFGNKTSVSVSGVDVMPPRTGTSTYDSLGEFATANTNALNQGETWQYNPQFGKPTSHTGPNGLSTYWDYDSFGHKIYEARPDGNTTIWAYLFCSGYNGGTATCPTGAVYLIQATQWGETGAQNGPTNTVYYDMLDREIVRETQGFDDSLIQTSKQYDGFGRLAQQSRPYFVSGGTARWTTYQYDALNRATLETYPDSTTTQHAFHGLVTVDTNANGQTRTTTKNSQGNVVAVTDAASHTTSYVYDPFDKLIKTTDAAGNVVSATYDVRGRKLTSNDPDLGLWYYAHNVASELVGQIDAKGQTTNLYYDQLGRLVYRVEPDLTSRWTYDTAAYGIGKLASATASGAATGTGPQGFQRSFTYDSLSRPTQVEILINSAGAYCFSATYDTNSRLSSVTYPSGFIAYYGYTQLGYLQVISDATDHIYWQADARDAELRLTQQTAGNGIVTTQNFDPLTDRLTSILAGTSNAVESFSYTYDALGNLLTRADANENLTETFSYDNLNRLLSATVSANIAPVKTFAYGPIGNLLSKSDVGTYSYRSPGRRCRMRCRPSPAPSTRPSPTTPTVGTCCGGAHDGGHDDCVHDRRGYHQRHAGSHPRSGWQRRYVSFSEAHLANIVGHALVGWGQAAASGGKCGAGALAGAVTSAAGPFIYEPGVTVQGIVANAALGGGAAVLGGGKFENG
jgi:YD repeat-containing protein